MLSQQKSPQKFDGKLTRPTAETADSLAGINVKERGLALSQRKSSERKEEKKTSVNNRPSQVYVDI